MFVLNEYLGPSPINDLYSYLPEPGVFFSTLVNKRFVLPIFHEGDFCDKSVTLYLAGDGVNNLSSFSGFTIFLIIL